MKLQGRNNSESHQVIGFTLVELLVVIVILGLLATLVGQQVIHHVAKAKVTTAKTQIAYFKSAISTFKLDTGQYPDNSMGLNALLEEPPGRGQFFPDFDFVVELAESDRAIPPGVFGQFQRTAGTVNDLFDSGRGSDVRSDSQADGQAEG